MARSRSREGEPPCLLQHPMQACSQPRPVPSPFRKLRLGFTLGGALEGDGGSGLVLEEGAAKVADLGRRIWEGVRGTESVLVSVGFLSLLVFCGVLVSLASSVGEGAVKEAEALGRAAGAGSGGGDSGMAGRARRLPTREGEAVRAESSASMAGMGSPVDQSPRMPITQPRKSDRV